MVGDSSLGRSLRVLESRRGGEAKKSATKEERFAGY
jgi:hypothetical protein